MAADPDQQRDPVEKSLGDQATGTDASPSDEKRSLGDEATSGDALSSLSDLASDLGEAIDSDLPLIDLAARYEIEGELGQGGMGAVLLATDRQLKRKVAIKRIHTSMAQSKTALQRFVTEAQSIAALNHFNIVQIHDYGRDTEGPFIIMELVEGKSLLDKLNEGKLEIEEAVDIACQLCDGLVVAHEQGIVHRDIKPANILLTKRGEPKLTDFGLARQNTADHGQTEAGVVLGTIDFMPPEQRRDAQATDARSDLWSLAATCYQMITGSSPKVIRLDQLPTNLAPVIGKMLEEDPANRFQDAASFRDALKQVLTQPSPADVATTPNDPTTEGRCAHCGTINDPSRKFCDSCGESLQEPCLSCRHLNRPWNRICGECGSKLQESIAAKQEQIAAQKTAVGSLRREYRYEEALKQLQRLTALNHPRFAADKAWAEENSSSLKPEYQQQIKNREAIVALATEEASHGKFAEAIKLLEEIPTPLRNQEALDFLKQFQQSQQEKDRLFQDIQEMVASKELAGLLQKTARLLQLSPGDPQLEKMHAQLQQREQQVAAELQQRQQQATAELQQATAELQQRRQQTKAQAAKILNRAEQQFAQYQDQAALETLSRCPEQFRQSARVERLHGYATNRLARVQKLTEIISGEQRPVAKLQVVEKYLELRPDDQQMQQLELDLRCQLRETKVQQEQTEKNRQRNKNILIALACMLFLFSLLIFVVLRFERAIRVDRVIREIRTVEEKAAAEMPERPPQPANSLMASLRGKRVHLQVDLKEGWIQVGETGQLTMGADVDGRTWIGFTRKDNSIFFMDSRFSVLQIRFAKTELSVGDQVTFIEHAMEKTDTLQAIVDSAADSTSVRITPGSILKIEAAQAVDPTPTEDE